MIAEITPPILLIILLIFTFFWAKKNLKKELRGQSVHSQEFRNNIDSKKLIILKTYYLKIGSLILTIVLFLKLLFILFFTI